MPDPTATRDPRNLDAYLPVRTSAITWIRVARALVGTGSLDRHVIVRGRKVHLENRGPDAVMGRFGGGWERELGIQLGRRGLSGTIILNLWRGSIRIDPRK